MLENGLFAVALLGLLLAGAIFGFFYAWVCSTMWGLDQADPRVAIAAMQAMNASVRNAVFAPAFFATPWVLIAAGLMAWGTGRGTAALVFMLAGLVYLAGGQILTIMVNVPMNEELAKVAVPEDRAAAEAIWQAYSPRWQTYNQARTIASGISLALAGWGMWLIART